MNKTTWKLTLAYDGTDFHGWQVQPPQVQPASPVSTIAIPTVQGALADAIAAVTGERVLPQGAGRTDAGVHADAQVASFDLGAPIPAENLHRALNRALPPSIRILSAEKAPLGFHARHSAIGKVYRYRVFRGAVCSPFQARYVAGCRWPLDLASMQQAAQAIVGHHDFTSFAAHDPDRAARQQASQPPPNLNATPNPNLARHNVRRIDFSHWSCASPASTPNEEMAAALDANGQLFTYEVRGSGFLHHMVRNLVGTFIEVGRGRIAPSRMAEILEARDRALAGPTAAASGLWLMKVLY